MEVVTQLLSRIRFINDCIFMLTGSPGKYAYYCICYLKKLGVTIILQFSQRNGKLTLPWKRQVNHPVITIYGSGYVVDRSDLVPLHQQ